MLIYGILPGGEDHTAITVSSGGAQAIRPKASRYQTTKLVTCRYVDFDDQKYNNQGLMALTIHLGAVKTELKINLSQDMHKMLFNTPKLCADALVWLTRERKEWFAWTIRQSMAWDMAELESGKDDNPLKKDLFKLRLTI
ncbi:uncharacterized protein PAC_17585 [Phialocephala subalpina]|uniref:Uncharacterized protein n=1 Tax=Phialocephala subalpina TaxID=576137 RepID=A0A1L7XRK3_9HELO|nr:uncharacterized protein PAC_17585 [Phialocephala subalpina]